VLGESNLHLQAPWNVRMRAIQQLRLLLAAPALLKCNVSGFVEKLLPALVVQVAFMCCLGVFLALDISNLSVVFCDANF
jgi:hypothetical protein